MTTDAAAERSAGAPALPPGHCCVCGAPFRNGSSFAARACPMRQVCSAECVGRVPFGEKADG